MIGYFANEWIYFRIPLCHFLYESEVIHHMPGAFEVFPICLIFIVLDV